MKPTEVDLIAGATVACVRMPRQHPHRVKEVLERTHGWTISNKRMQVCMDAHGFWLHPNDIRWMRSLLVLDMLYPKVTVESFRDALVDKEAQYQRQHPGAQPLNIPSLPWMRENRSTFCEMEPDEAILLDDGVEDLQIEDEGKSHAVSTQFGSLSAQYLLTPLRF